MGPSGRYGLPCRAIDVAMVVFNEAALVRESVGALLRAGFDRFVVLDMQSTDGTAAILADLLGDRLALHTFPRASLLHHGFAEARNSCAALCQRPFVLFVDADEMLVSGVENGRVALDGGPDLRDLYAIERRNLAASATAEPVVGSVEHHHRLYRPRPALRWIGYIHETIAPVAGAEIDRGDSALVFDHHSFRKKGAEIAAKEGLYATMLVRALNDVKVRPGINPWYFDTHIPRHIDYLRDRALDHVGTHTIDPLFHPTHPAVPVAEDMASPPSLFARDEAGADVAIDLDVVRTLHSLSAEPWTGRRGRAHWCEWRHPSEGSRSLSTILQSCESFHWPRFIRPGDTLVDIGGHSGDTAVPMALFGYDRARGRRAHVVVVEPNPAVLPVLRINLALNAHLGHFHLLEAAITREDTDAIELADHGNAECNGGVLRADLSADVAEKLAAVAGVRYVTRGVALASLFEAAKRESDAPIGFLKLDCEGYDKEILRPCRELLAVDRPVIFVEWFDWFQPADDADLFAVIAAIDYVAFDPRSFDRATLDRRASDLLCVHRDRLAEFGLAAPGPA